ncbi:hypothetical protein CYL21_2252 [Plasmodium falciparum NF54]|uniref:Phosphoglycerate mutase n=2 Tax=Plasmodium falciparum TaxID=5833 RepID=Q8ILZ9_PLAF7|nr:conserved Plasmodium protein, unknown function [Plasmodium falciparum 3D7]EWC86193.1 hypothetical protein PFNF54_04924 [Plasmodium falciparum NF54]KAF4329090.1 hypothetical protein CYL21_2252 [Plasmodium falciparum NF54]PKC49745.1 hypothetical protein CK202_0473 [Plasmodium falciparum NF54]CZT99804.1 conserved Plasmodium protein, unknown function [Plasmodium falciparum 3D7]|eukprot:XP_001348267.1 conserved Plasmodium protein, unknown function [Plasmodium falciparum 3D7]
MNYCTLLTICFFFCLFLTNVVYEYVHVLNSKKRKSRLEENNDKKKLFKFFLHILILKQIIFESFINLAIKMSILLHVVKRYLTYNKKNYIGYIKNEEDHDIKKVDNNNNKNKNNYYLNNNFNDKKEKEKDTKDEKKNKKKNKINYPNNDNEIIGNNNNTNMNEIKIYNNNFINNDYVNYNNILKNNTNHLENKKNVKVKTIYFIRHSESVWNSVFNKEMSTKQFLKMFMVILYELVFLFSKKSALIDSPLSNTGIIQSIELSNFLLEGRTDFNDEFCEETFNHIEYINDKNKTNDNNINNKDEYIINNNNYNNIDLYKLSKKKLKKNKNSISNYNKKQENNDILTTNNNDYSHDNSNDNHKIHEEQDNILPNVKNYITYDNDHDNYSNKGNYNYRNDEYNHEEIINLNLKDHIDILNNKKYDSVLLCSDLRRTISSCFISFYNRINKNNEDIYVLNSLQEISRNPDCVPLMKYYNKYVTTDIEKFLHKDVEKLFRKNIKFNKNFTRNSFLDTLDYIFNHEKNIFIIFGHSLWFLHFFKYFLKESHKAKTNKLKNASVIVFNIYKYENDDEESTTSFKVEEVIQNDDINQDQNTTNQQQEQYNTQQEHYNTQQEHYNTQQEHYNTQQEHYNTQQEQYNHDINNMSDTEYLTHDDLTENSDYLSSNDDYEEDVTKADEQENYYENHNDDIVLHHVDNLQHIRHRRNSDNSYEEEPSNTTKAKKKLKLKNPKRKHKLHKKNKKNKIFVNEKVKYEVDQNSIRVLYKGFDEN